MSFVNSVRRTVSLFKQAIRGDEQDFTQGSINRAILLLSVPMIIEMSLEAVFALVDALYVSMLNDNGAVAVIGVTESVLTIMYSIAMGLSMAATALIARRIGEKNVQEARVSAVQVLIVGGVLSIAISLVGVLWYADILALMGISDSIIAASGNYALVMFAGNITIMMLFIINAIFRGAGDASLAMRSLLISNGLNIILDPLFIFGAGPYFEGYGVVGAAIATNLGRGIGVVYQVSHLFRGKGIIKLGDAELFTVRWEIIGRIIKIASGGAGQFIIASASWIFLMRIISHFGEAAQAGYTFAIRVIVFTILPSWGMANASATLVGQNLGANQPERAEKSVWKTAYFNVVFLALVMVVFLTLSPQIIGIFTEDQEVLHHGVRCLQLVSLGYVFYGYGMVISQSFNGAGDTRTPTILNFFGFWMLQIPLAYVLALPLDFGTSGVFFAITFAESVLAIVSIYIFRMGRWKTVKV